MHLISSILLTLAATTFALPAIQQNTPIPVPPGIDTTPNCANPTTKWQVHYCTAQANQVQQGCMPQRRFANNPSSSLIKGIVLLFHGFTACPDAMEFLAANLQAQGYHVYIPLNPGHGLPLGSCSRPGAICVDNYPVDQLPTTKEGYINFATWAVDMIKEELGIYAPVANRDAGFTVATSGLSLGGPLSTIATWYGKGLFSKTVLINPFYSAAEPSLDYNVQKCQGDANPSQCMNNVVSGFLNIDAAANAGQNPNNGATPVGFGTLLNIFKSKAVSAVEWSFTNLVGNVLVYHYNEFMKVVTDSLTDIEEHGGNGLSVMTNKFGWGAGCIANTARAGYCTFMIKNLLAVNAVGMYSVSRANKIQNANIAIMGTVRDGFTREGIIYATADTMLNTPGANNKVSMCIYHAAPGCADIVGSNSCGVPHSLFSRAENYYNEPYTLYWETDLFNNVVGFISGTRTAIGTAGAVDKAVCGFVALNNQAAYSGIVADGSLLVSSAQIRWPN
ncbi:hypothetical protein HDU76_010837 [Blyttiomyces sp. JEL0837]|nr:hypothetical protein HDU76_010837 [Blyttiomyces sp. JEL0837]